MTPSKIEIPYAEANGLAGRGIDEVVAIFLGAETRADANDRPTAVIVMGNYASGKTMFRREQYATSHVSLDPVDIYQELTLDETQVPTDIAERVDAAGRAIVRRALAEHHNVVFEFVAVDDEEICAIIEALKARGYRTKLDYLHCDEATASKQNRERPPEDISSYFTQATLVALLFDALMRSRGV